MRRLLLFDIDGTLLDAGGAGRSALEDAMLEVYGVGGPFEPLPFDGKTDPAIARALLGARGLDDDAIDERFGALWDAYALRLDIELRRTRARVTTRPGAVQLVERLVSDGRYAVGLLTGNIERGAWRKLAAARLDDWFAFGAFGSDAERREELPPIALERARAATGTAYEPREAIVIGDTPADIACARAGGTRVVAVATGRFTEAELAAHGPDWVIPSLEDDHAVRVALEAP